jgi:hypothetical protein
MYREQDDMLARSTIEIDGCIKVELSLLPAVKAAGTQNEPATIERLWLEIPLRDEVAPLMHVVTTGLNSLLRNPLWSMNFLTNVLANLSFAVRSTAIRTQEDQTRLVGTEDFVAGPCFRVVTGDHPADETPVVEVCNNSTTALEEAVFAVMDESGEKHARLASAVRLIASAYGYNPAANREFYVTQSTVIEAVARENLNEIMDDLRESLMPEVK